MINFHELEDLFQLLKLFPDQNIQGPQALSELKDIKNIEKDKILIICTGSQGEPRGALNRIAHGTHRDVSISQCLD